MTYDPFATCAPVPPEHELDDPTREPDPLVGADAPSRELRFRATYELRDPVGGDPLTLLLSACWRESGKHVEFNDWFDALHGELERFARRRMRVKTVGGRSGEDVVAEVWMDLVERAREVPALRRVRDDVGDLVTTSRAPLPPITTESELRRFLFTSVYQNCLSTRRDYQPTVAAPWERDEDSDRYWTPAADCRDAADLVDGDLDALVAVITPLLTDRDRELLEFLYSRSSRGLREWNASTLAAELGVKPATVRKRIERLRAKLRPAIIAAGIDPGTGETMSHLPPVSDEQDRGSEIFPLLHAA